MTPLEKAKAEAEGKRVAHLRAVLQAAIDKHRNRKMAAFELGVEYHVFTSACSRYKPDTSVIPETRGGAQPSENVKAKRAEVVRLKSRGMSHQQIADQLGSTKGAVSMHISRDRQERRVER